MPTNHPRQTGFTLVETLVSVCLGAIVAAMAAPALGDIIANSRITTEINNMAGHLHLARSEAVKRGQRAVICPSDNGERCLGSGDWAGGYMVFIDADEDRRRDADEPVVNFHQIDARSVRVNAGTRKTVTYRPTGWAPGSNLTITFCDAYDRVPPKAVIVSMTGRPRVDHIHPNGGALNCPINAPQNG